MSGSVRPHRWQPTTLPCPWESPGKNTGVDFHFLLQCMKVKRESEVAQSCLTLRDPMDCGLPASSVHGIFQARVLESVAISFSEVTLYTLLILGFCKSRDHHLICYPAMELYNNINSQKSKILSGLPWWLSGKESTCQCKSHGFNPWSRMIPHASEQLSQWATTTEPMCCNNWSPCVLEPLLSQQEKLTQWETQTWQLQSSPCSLQPEKNPHSNEDSPQIKK